MPTAAQLPSVIREKLSAMDRQQRELSALSGVGEFLCLAALAAGACLLVDAWGNLSPVGRSGLLIGLATVLITGAWFRIVRPFLHRRSWAELAAAVEQDHPELKERLTTLVELRSDAEFARVSSPLMQELLANQTVKAVSQLEFTETLPAGRSLQRGALGLAALAVLLLPFLMPGGRYALSWQRLLVPWANHDWGQRLAFSIPDGDRVVAKGSDVALQAELIGTQPSADAPLAVQLRWVDDHGRTHQRPMDWHADDHTYAVTLPRVEQSFRYKVSSRAAVSREYRITAAERPQIAAWHIEIQPPGYTGLPAQTLDAVVGELTVPEQSRVTFRWQFAEPVAAASISWPETFVEHAPQKSDDAVPEAKIRTMEKSLMLSADRRSATVELPATADGPFGVLLTSALGLESDKSSHSLAIIPDEPPSIDVVKANKVTSIQPDDVLPISSVAGDDYGLSAVELHWTTSTGEQGSRAIPAEELTECEIAHRWELDVADWKLSSGQAVTYRLRAVDNRPVPGPQETWTDPVTVAVSSRAELVESRELASAQEALERELDALKNALAEQQQAVDQQHRETAREAVRGDQQPENKEELEKLKERQQALRDQVESLREELQQRPLMAQAAKDHLPQIERKLADAEKSLDEAARAKEARDQIEKLSQSLDELAEAENQLDQLKQESKALAALEQELAELGRLSRKAEKLADQAEALEQQAGEAQEPAKPPATAEADAEELDRLRKETAELTEHLDDLLRRRPELLEAARQQELDRLARLAEMAERLAQPQAQLAEALSREAKNDAPTQPPEAAEPSNDPQRADPPDQTDDATPPDAANTDPSEQPPTESNGENSKSPSDQSSPDMTNAPDSNPEADDPGEPEPAADGETGPPGNGKNSPDEKAESLSQQVSRAVQQQQQLAREAAALQKSPPADPANPVAAPEPATPAGAEKGESTPAEKKSGEPSTTADGEKSPARSAEDALGDFANQSQAAAESAQAGDLQQAAEQSRQASQSAQQAAKAGSPTEGQPESPAGEKAGELADRQQELAEEFERLAQSSEARHQAQQQSQQQLQQATESLAQALEQSAAQLSQQPLNQPQPGQSAADASQSAKSAGESMQAAAESLAQGDPNAASQQAQAAQAQLSEAAQQARAAQGDQRPSSPQGGKVPGQTAGQVARAAHQLKQAQEHLAQAGQPSATPDPGSSSNEDSSDMPQSPDESRLVKAQTGIREKPLEQSAAQLRQAAKSLSAACKACQNGGGKPGSDGKPGSPGKPGSAADNSSQIAGQPAEPGDAANSPAGLAALGQVVGDSSEELGTLTESARPSAGLRNWGRLPKNLQTEILQGSTKKSHPEYSRQIKNYFEQIAQPAAKQDRP